MEKYRGKPDEMPQFIALQRDVETYLLNAFKDRAWYVFAAVVDESAPTATCGSEDFSLVGTDDLPFSVFVNSESMDQFKPISAKKRKQAERILAIMSNKCTESNLRMDQAKCKDKGQRQALSCLQNNFGDLLGISYAMINYWAIIAPPPGKSKSKHPLAR